MSRSRTLFYELKTIFKKMKTEIRKKNESPSRSSLFQYFHGDSRKVSFYKLVGNIHILHLLELGSDSTCLGRLILWHPPNKYLKNIFSGWEADLRRGSEDNRCWRTRGCLESRAQATYASSWSGDCSA